MAMALAAMAIPRFVTLKSKYNNKYLRYVQEDVQIHGFLVFNGEEVVSPYAKYEIEMAKSGNGLVHIRCCYNNKYWVRQKSNSYWILADADEPEEDQSKWSCTLFKPVAVDGDASAVRFVHVQLGHYACLWGAQAPFTSCLFAGSKNINGYLMDAFAITDWESLLILPKHVAFKGDLGMYLRAFYDDHEYLQFSSSDIGSEFVGNEVFTMKDGAIRIKNDHWGKFWRRSPNWIWADSTDTTDNNRDTLFQPVKVGDNVVALRNLGNNYFCKRLNADGMDNCLNAATPTITKEARIQVEELVISRNIYNVSYRLMDARIYGQTPLLMANGEATNGSTEPNTVDVKLKYTDTKTSSWNASVSLKLGVKTNIKTGIPLIAEGQIEISAEFSAAYEWGSTNSSQSELETVYTVIVPPRTRVKVSLLATKGTCDVPFSYSQRDTLFNGTQTTYSMDDGVYTGINCYNFTYATEQVSL